MPNYSASAITPLNLVTKAQLRSTFSMNGKTKIIDLRFEVKDQGIGIPAQEQHTLFSPFHQLDRSMTRQYGGNGIGLALCSQLIEHMKGKIGVQSQPGEGSLFWFTVTLKTAGSQPQTDG